METTTNRSNLPSSIFTILIAKSGRGKTTSLMYFNPEDTFIINVMGKGLPFQNANAYKEGENLYIDPTSMGIQTMMKRVSDNEKFNNLIIDDGQYIMATEFVDKAHEKGFDKWNILARNIWNIFKLANNLRKGLKVYFLCHEDVTETQRKMKTLGKLLEDKLEPEGLAPIVLFGEVFIENGKRKYYFTTQSDGITTAHSPMGMFPYEIPNNLDLVSKRIDEYYNGVVLKDSKLKFDIEEVV